MTSLVQAPSVGVSTRFLGATPTPTSLLVLAYGGRNGTGTIDGSYHDSGEGEVVDAANDVVAIAAKIAGLGEPLYSPGTWNNNARLAFAEFSGIASAIPSDTAAGIDVAYDIDVGTVTAQEGDLVVIAMGCGSGGGFDAANWHAGGTIPWTVDPEWIELTDGTYVGGAKVQDGHPLTYLGYQIAAADGPIAIRGSFVNNGSGPWPMSIVAAVYAGTPTPPAPGIHITIDDVELTEVTDPRIRVELDATGSGSFKINRHSAEALASLLQPGKYATVTIPQIDPDPIFGFFLEGDTAPDTPVAILASTDEEGGETITFGGRGGLAYWERAIWLAESFLIPWWPGTLPDPDPSYLGAISFAAGSYVRYTTSGGHASSPIAFTTGGFTAYYDQRRQFTRTGLGPITLVHLATGSHSGWWVHPFGHGVTDYKRVAHYRFGNSVLMESIADGDKPGQVLYEMYRESQAAERPEHPLPSLAIDFNDTVDSNGDPWTTTDALAALSTELGDDYLSTVGKLINTGVVDVYMDPDLTFHAYNHLGRDLTGSVFGPGVVRLAKASNIADTVQRQYTDAPTGTFIEVQGMSEGVIARATRAGDIPRELSLRGDSDDTTVLASLGEAELALRALHSDSVGFNVAVPIIGREDADNGRYVPGPPGSAHGDFWVGDLITLHTGTEEHDFDEDEVRVAAISLWLDELDLRASVEVISGFGGIPTLGSPSSPGPTAGGTGQPSTISDLYQLLEERDQPQGYPSLDSSGRIPRAELGSQWKQSVRGASVTGGGAVLSDFVPGFTHDGVTYAEGDDFLWKDSASPPEHGIYVVADSGDPFRRDDFDEADEVVGAMVMVREGNSLSGTVWRCSNVSAPVIDTNDIDFERFLPDSDVAALFAAAFGYLAHGNTGSTETFDASAAGWHSATLDASTVTATFAGATAGQVASMVLELAQDGTGGRAIDFPASVINGSDLESSLSTDPSTTTYFVFFSHDGGTNWIGFVLGGSASGASSSSGMVPTYLNADETFTVPARKQALFSEAIDGPGLLIVYGSLIEVD